MTNHLCMINEGASVYSINKNCNKIDEEIINSLLLNVGISKKVDEKQMNIFTAFSGSAPAFVYNFADSLIEGGLKNGIDVNTAKDYAIQVIYGAAKFMKNNKDNYPSNLKYKVTTPNGTTIAGLNQLEKYKFKYAISQALSFASQRGAEIEAEKLNNFSKPKF